jgi:hypothetical protein
MHPFAYFSSSMFLAIQKWRRQNPPPFQKLSPDQRKHHAFIEECMDPLAFSGMHHMADGTTAQCEHLTDKRELLAAPFLWLGNHQGSDNRERSNHRKCRFKTVPLDIFDKHEVCCECHDSAAKHVC